MGDKKEINILSLFSGCGGLDYGFEQEGFLVPFANEFWKPAQDSYEFSHPNTELFRDDIRNLTNEKIDVSMKLRGIKKIDLIIGGPPCQGFSMAGSRNKDDPRNKLFLEFVRIVDHLEPLFFVFENVKGLLTMKDDDGKFVIDKIVKEFKKVDGGYVLQYKLLNSADYGVPQKRERVILIGTKLNINEKLLHPIPTHSPKDNLNEIKSWFKRNGKYFFGLKNDLLNSIYSCKDLNNLPKDAKKILNKMDPWKTVIEVIGDIENLEDDTDEFNPR